MVSNVNTASNILGGAFAFASGCLLSIGQTLLKKSHVKAGTSGRYYMRCDWWFGLIITIFGYVCIVAASATGDAVLIVAVRGLTVAPAQVALPVFWLKEPLLWTDIFATIFLIAGGIIFSIEAQPSKNYNIHQIQNYESNITWIVFISSFAFIIITIPVVLGLLRTYFLKDDAKERWEHTHCMIYAVISSILGGSCQIAVSVVSKLLISDASESIQTYAFWIWFAGVIVALVAMIHYQQKALGLGDAIPVLNISTTLCISTNDLLAEILFDTNRIIYLGHSLMLASTLLYFFHRKSKHRLKSSTLINEVWDIPALKSEIMTGYR